MALAYLCRQWEVQRQKQKQQQQEHHIPGLANSNTSSRDEASVIAFVVDHKARPESTDEANTVATWLRELGITTEILPLDWTGIGLSAFETNARRLRFQALGKACRDRGIDALLLGHHQDDNVETTLWRLSSGARGAGLTGISPVARIPECHGLYGVAASGSAVLARDYWQGQKHEIEQTRRGELPVATGGILIHRPLLSFPKSRLLTTCHENEIPYVTDPTNFDPTLTPRNAIRSLLASDSLPRALRSESILSLIGKCQRLIRDSHNLSDKILASNTTLLGLELKSGSFTIRFKPAPCTWSSHDEEGGISPSRLQELQSLTLRRITDLVSPYEDNHFPLRSYVDFTGRVFHPNPPTSSTNSDSYSNSELPERASQAEGLKAFTVGGVLFQPLASSPLNQGQDSDNNHNTWLLTRQPYMRRREPVLRFNVNRPTAQFKPIDRSLEQHSESIFKVECHIPWTLWDNRFWIRASMTPISKSEPISQEERDEEKRIQLVIRPLRQSDLTPLKRLYNKTKTKNPQAQAKKRFDKPIHEYDEKGGGRSSFDAAFFFAVLDREAPGPSRFTVPVLTLEEEGAVDVPLALPTMDLTFPVMDSTPCALKWEWKYKMIDLETLKLMDPA
ncbi:PP-loop family-domain-containing protein [Aspergillus nidulans var. acristatus]